MQLRGEKEEKEEEEPSETGTPHALHFTAGSAAA